MIKIARVNLATRLYSAMQDYHSKVLNYYGILWPVQVACTVNWEIFKVQSFQEWVPFANKFLRMAIWLSLIKWIKASFVLRLP